MQSKATTVAQYLRELPADRRMAIEAVRKVILDNLDPDIEEGMGYGMIGYAIPHRVFPPGYHCSPKLPLPFAALASQKNYMSLYLMTVYGEGAHWERFTKEWAKTGKKLDMGKCCLRFKKLEDLALDVIARAIRSVSAADYIRNYETALAQPHGQARKATRKTGSRSAKSTPEKKTAKRATKKVARKR